MRLLLVSFLGGFLLTGSAFAASADFDQGVGEFNNRHYSQALSHLQSAASAQPYDARTHYYLGLCYQYLSQMSAAQAEYDWVRNNAEDADLRRNAQTALDGLNRWSQHREYAGQGNNFQSQPNLHDDAERVGEEREEGIGGAGRLRYPHAHRLRNWRHHTAAAKNTLDGNTEPSRLDDVNSPLRHANRARQEHFNAPHFDNTERSANSYSASQPHYARPHFRNK